MDNTIIITEEGSIDNYVSEYDIAVCGYGGAGGSAAIEAANNNSQVILFERASDGGGSTALSSCEMYLGGSGGTSLQNACGFEDSSANMIAYIEASLEGKGDQKKIKLYCENAADHFEWVKSLGVNYKESAHLGRIVVPESNESLLFTGNERASPFSECAKPIPRGHVPSHEGDFGGKIFFDALKKTINKTKNISVSFDSRVLGLVVDKQNVIVGVSFKKDNILQHVKVKKGVILTAGGFVMNEEMIKKYLPFQTSFGAPYGNPWDKGDGIQIGLTMNANVINMDEAFFGVYFYPPESLTYGIFVNSDGNRFVNEDSYGARIGYYCSQQKDQKIYMVIQNEDFEPSIYIDKLPILAVAETIEELEVEAGFREGSISSTIKAYNSDVRNGKDSKFKKAPQWLKEISKPPFAIIDYSFSNQASPAYSDKTGPLMFTLGGLETLPTGEVLNKDGEVIPKLYAAGRTTAGLPKGWQRLC
ncbi:MAG: putative fumarate reductase/succinate dehydrogenase [Gammaproteobacteria bacterium]|nr:MAG: putative fumarate reductase/succinate dehydrogenase [Gammaproteobacteria bacterium]